MIELPNWFSEFSSQQIDGVECNYETLENKSIEELQIIYIKTWSVIEIFSKIIFLLSSKRIYLKVIEQELKSIEDKRLKISQYKSQIQELIDYYKASIDGKESKLGFDAIAAIPCELKRKKFKQYSVLKNVVSKEPLPKKEMIVKSLKNLGIEEMKFCTYLNSDASDSLYYKTRNKIAHEGIADLSKSGLIKERLLVVLEAANEINLYITKHNKAI